MTQSQWSWVWSPAATLSVSWYWDRWRKGAIQWSCLRLLQCRCSCVSNTGESFSDKLVLRVYLTDSAQSVASRGMPDIVDRPTVNNWPSKALVMICNRTTHAAVMQTFSCLIHQRGRPAATAAPSTRSRRDPRRNLAKQTPIHHFSAEMRDHSQRTELFKHDATIL